MIYLFQKYKVSIIFILLLFFSLFQFNDLYGQEWFLLSDKGMVGYNLLRERTFKNFDSIFSFSNSHKQVWMIEDEKETKPIYINYYSFNSIPEAIIGTNKLSRQFAISFVWGSPMGKIYGEETWSTIKKEVNEPSSIFFVHQNIGIQIIVPYIQNKNSNDRINSLANKIISKRNPSIINPSAYNNAADLDSTLGNTSEIEISNILPGYSLEYSKISYWAVDSIGCKIGVRRIWQKDISTIGIDICNLNNLEEVQKIAKTKTNNCSLSGNIYDLNNTELDQMIRTEWDFYRNSRNSNKTFSFIGFKGNSVVHIYGLNVDETNYIEINAIIKEIAK